MATILDAILNFIGRPYSNL